MVLDMTDDERTLETTEKNKINKDALQKFIIW